ncbi:MAG: CHAT domain-containing protein, partial [Bacteroidota bacterium]
ASKAEFMKIAPGARVIHIAAHARLDDETPMNSYIQLATDGTSEEEGKVRAVDLLSMNLSAELVVLSGCNTGSSQQSGSSRALVRGFMAGGVPAVVASLWNVDDNTAPDFMATFYRFLKEGERKSRALQLAKLDLIRKGKRDPFYWAGYVLIGDPSPLSPDEASLDGGIQRFAAMMVIIPLLLLTVVVSLGLWRRREARAPHRMK